jgi:GTP cyclohydrolase II
MDFRLTRAQKNDVFRLVEAKMNPRDFGWSDLNEDVQTPYGSDQHHRISMLIHVPSLYYFRFGAKQLTFSPSLRKRVEVVQRQEEEEISGVVSYWLIHLKKEVEAPDLWAQHLKDVQIRDLVVSTDVTNETFSEPEKEKILLLLQDFKQKVLEAANIQSDQSKQIEAINENVEYLKSAADRLGRKDWILVAISTIISIATTALLPGNAANALLHGFIAAVGPIVSGGVRLIL